MNVTPFLRGGHLSSSRRFVDKLYISILCESRGNLFLGRSLRSLYSIQYSDAICTWLVSYLFWIRNCPHLDQRNARKVERQHANAGRCSENLHSVSVCPVTFSLKLRMNIYEVTWYLNVIWKCAHLGIGRHIRIRQEALHKLSRRGIVDRKVKQISADGDAH